MPGNHSPGAVAAQELYAGLAGGGRGPGSGRDPANGPARA